MPAPLPGLNLVPRWRTMISPPVTDSPANTFTPRRLALESRPLREEPRPFLCAISRRSLALDRGDPDARQFLTMAGAALVAALRLELEDAQLWATEVLDDLGLDGGLGQAITLEDGVPIHRREAMAECRGWRHMRREDVQPGGPGRGGGGMATRGLDDCVGHCL